MSIREILLRNKDLLDVIFTLVGLVSATALGIMAIILARNSNRTAVAQLKVMDNEMRLANEQARPLLRLAWQTGLGEGGNIECVQVYNDGPALTSLFIVQRTLLEISRVGKKDETRHFPIYYLFDRYFTGQGSGLLATL